MTFWENVTFKNEKKFEKRYELEKGTHLAETFFQTKYPSKDMGAQTGYHPTQYFNIL